VSSEESGKAILTGIPESLRAELLRAFQEILRNYRDGRWEPSELNGGKFCEVVFTVLKGYIDKNFPTAATKPANMVDACRALESASAPRSVRIQMPRMLIALYEIRNNRGVGHVGGDVDPNHMDATAVLAMSKWLLAELVRIFHDVDTMAAAKVVDAIVERDVPVIWFVNGKRRILDVDLSMREKMLLILYQSRDQIAEKDLIEWLEHSNASVFRRDVIRPSHKERLIEYNDLSGRLQISPKGAQLVEASPRLNKYFRG
jgi:hypothetical protein